jgi:hypothetical protein
MKRADKSAETIRNFDSLISKLSENEIIDLNSMRCIRGGDGNGSTPIVVPPPPPINQ